MTQTFAIGDPRVEARSVTGSIRRGRRGRRHVPRPTGRAVRERRHRTPGPSARPLAVLRAVTVCVSAIVAGCETSTPLAASLLQRPASGSVYRKAVTPAEAKLDSRLLAAVDRLRAGAPPLSVRDALQVDARQRVLVDMRADVTPELLEVIEAGGGIVVSQFPQYNAIRAWTPIEALIPLAERNDVRGIRPADRAVTR